MADERDQEISNHLSSADIKSISSMIASDIERQQKKEPTIIGGIRIVVDPKVHKYREPIVDPSVLGVYAEALKLARSREMAAGIHGYPMGMRDDNTPEELMAALNENAYRIERVTDAFRLQQNIPSLATSLGTSVNELSDNQLAEFLSNSGRQVDSSYVRGLMGHTGTPEMILEGKYKNIHGENVSIQGSMNHLVRTREQLERIISTEDTPFPSESSENSFQKDDCCSELVELNRRIVANLIWIYRLLRQKFGVNQSSPPGSTGTGDTEGGKFSFKNMIQSITNELEKLVKSIRNLQQNLGITAGAAIAVRFDTLASSVSSYASTILTLGTRAAVNFREIETAISDFRQEFGGLISREDATELAKSAKEMGITTQQLAAARRVFMTQTMGDLTRAQSQQERFVKVFTQQGMTSRDAMEFIAKNSELMARNGVRFQSSMARAAAEAKKIGVDLSKVNQVGDNIIGNFEGFLESMAELGAMGFAFDATRLAEIAERGDTDELLRELRSQLKTTGMDLTDLTRSQQLSLSSAFGMQIDEFQRLAGITPGVGQAETERSILTRIFNTLEGMLGTIQAVNTVLSGVHSLQLGIIARNTGRMAGVSFPGGKLGTAGRLGAGAAGVGIGLMGMNAAYTGAKEEDPAKSFMGGLGSVGGYALTGAMMGGPKGAAIGALLGLVMAGGSYMMGRGDDVVSRPGYGNRLLVTPTATVSLNNEDNVVAYADDMISRNTGIELLSKGIIAEDIRNTSPDVNVNIDLGKLERKLDQVISAMASIQVVMDGNKVGRVIFDGEEKANTIGVFQTQRIF